MTDFAFEVSQVEAEATRMEAHALSSYGAVAGLVAHHTALLHLRMMRKASGRPGPRAITGDFRRSITHEVKSGGGRSVGVAGSGAPQARRLENGFEGTDSLGREYHQPPFPWARPAGDDTEPGFVNDMTLLAATIADA